MLSYALAQCAQHGMNRVVVNAHWKSHKLQEWAGQHEGCEVEISDEQPDILGTGGGLHRVRDGLANRFVVLNGDVLNNVDLSALMAQIPEGGGILGLRPHEMDAQRYGVVAADEEGIIVQMRDIASAQPHGDVSRDTHFTGIHAMDKSMLELAEAGFSCIVRTAYKALVPQRRIRAFRHEGVWLDIGDPKAYLEANIAVLEGGVSLSLDPRPRAGRFIDDELDPSRVGPIWLGKGVDIGTGVSIRRSIIGHSASVAAGANLEDCVVWDGAHVPAGAHRRTIFYGAGSWSA
jgi:mannose-1-phosphate guanylyltransferase